MAAKLKKRREKSMKHIQKLGYTALGAVLALAIVLGTPALAASVQKTLNVSYNDIKIVVDGVKITPKDANGKVIEPFISDGTTYMPVRAVAEALGKPVSWDAATQTAYIGGLPSSEVKLSKLEYLSEESHPNAVWKYKDQAQANTSDYLNDCFTVNLSTGLDSSQRDYLLNGKYTKINGTIFLTYDSRSSNDDNDVININMWGDGKLIYKSDDVKGGVLPFAFDVDITGVKILKIGFVGDYWGDTSVGISEVTLK
jgi:hypothetical protein